ncbi:Ig-like domain repeat protein [Methanobrevibacter sp.]|uniref:Ig-like domain repeat protein n=1 Tax=Methanobrevibacter sp. TaxID=66852 RepID=UPI003870ED42
MGFKKAILVLSLLIILTIGAASAADNQTSDNLTFSEDSHLESSTEDITLTQNENNDNLTATPGTLTELREEIDAAAGSELKLTRDYEYSGSEYINVSVNYAMTIDGQGHTIDCKKARNLFLVYDDNVVLKNIKFANCKSDGFDGSAIHWYGNAGILENCSFENCTSAMDTSENAPNGGAIYWYGNNGRISNCSFEKCSAILLGGAIYWRGLNGSVSDCSFVKCSSVSSVETYTAGLASDGGAVYWAGINGTLSNCSFKECSASDKGYAIYWNGLNGTATGCSIVKFSTGEYGAVYWSGNNGDLTNCSFVNCSSTAYYGGVLYWTGVNGSIADCGFDSITGCAVHLFADNGNVCGSDFKNLTESGIHVEGVNGAVINCSFENCSTLDSGSAIDWGGINGSLINCGFINCSSNNHGGAVLWASEGGAILNSTFKDCFAFSNYGWGGAIKLTGSNCNVSECNFEGCHADRLGGAIYLTGNDCNVSGCNFEGCDADGQGGAICWEGSGTVSNCSFENCSAGSTTGAIIWINGNSKGQIEYSNFTNCYAPNTKAIYTSNEKVGIYSCIFEDNTTNDLNDLVSASNITQCILNGNPIKKDLVMNLTASEIIYGEEEIVIVSLPADATGNVTLSLADMIVTKFPVDGIINYNFPNLDAGAYAVTATYSGDDNYYPSNRTVNFIVNRKPSILSIVTTYDEYLTLLVNLTAGYGNVTININNESFFTIEITNGTYVLNVANMTPGSYYFTAEFLGNDNYEAAYVDTILTINATDTFKNLQDLIDAAGDELNLTSNFTYADGDTSVTINKPITINGNGYTINAKTIVGFKIKSDNVNLINITFLNGYNSMEHGGAIIWEGNGGSITNCSFTGCGCDGYGAAVSWQGANGLVSNCSFTDCNALNSGGSIHWSGANGRISNCEFTNSRSGYQGGAIFWQASDGRIEDSVFTTFKSTSQGNAIYITNNDVVVSGCDFEDARYDSIDTVVYGGQLLGYTLNGIRHKNVDLEISLLTNANGTLEIGDPFNINVTVHNSGSDDATGAYVSLSLPSSIVVTSANTLTGEYSTNGSIWDIGNLGADQTATLTLTAHAIQSGNITITSTAYALESDANPTDNTAQIEITVLDANTFEYLNTLITNTDENGVLELDKDYINDGSITDGGIIIGKAITIDGKGHTLDANGKSGMFLIGEDGVTLKNIVFKNGQHYNDADQFEDFGGAINWFVSNGNLINCSFINCSSSHGGGALYCIGNGNIINCSFINNTASWYGGAICLKEYGGSIINCSFVDNNGGGFGSAISGWDSDGSIIRNCSFTNCSSNGCIIDIDEVNANNIIGNTFNLNSMDEISKCVNEANITFIFDLNTIKVNGKAVSRNKYLKITFEDLQSLINSANAGDTIELDKDYINDGSISSEGIDVTKSITIDGNGHTLDAKCLSRVLNIKSDGVTLKNIIFRNAFIAGVNNGGAINNGGYNGNIFNCSFVNCSAGQSAGAVGGYGDESIFANCSFINCSSADHSGAVDWAYDCNIFNSTFVNCSARYGGAFACGWIGDNSIIYNCTFINCSSSSTVDSGGAIWFIGSNLCNIFHCTFINCLSKGEGGGVYFYGEGNISDCSFVNCSAKYGGAIYFNRQSNGYNCNFINCSAELGKAIYASDNTLIFNCNFETQGSESLSELVMGGITSNCTVNGKKEKTATNMTIITEDITYGENATITVTMTTDGTVTVNINNQNIGLEITNGTGQITIPNLNVGEYIVKASFEGNSDYESANATTTLTVTKIQSQLTIQPIPETTQGENINIIINVQNDATGTITLTVNGENYIANIENGQATFNITGLDAGNYEAIANYAGDTNYLASQNSKQFTVKSNMKTFEDIASIISNAHAGDEINLEGTYYGTGSTITVNKELSIKGNGETILDAKNLSGILSVSANNVRINNIRFVNGKINANGGAINWIGKNGTISNCTFINCSAENGGSVYWNAENGMINTSTFDKSTTTSNGGAIYWNANNGEIANSIFTNSYAQNGGAVYVPENRNVEIKSSIFDNNMAEEESGAVYGGTVDDDCTFKNNTYTPLNTTTIISINETAVYTGNDISITTLILSQKGGLVNTGTVEIYINSKLIATIPANTAYIYKTGDVGTYQVLAKFIDDSSYKDSSSTAEFTVISVDIPEEIETSTAGIFTLEFPDDAEGTLTVFIDGTKYKVYDIIGGILKIDLSDKKGKYNITFEYSGDKNYPAFKKDANVTVETNPSITASNAKVIYSAGTTYKITVYKNKGITANGVNVVIKQNNKAFKTIKTNSKGIASFKVTQIPGTYKLKITSLGKTVTKTLTVKHIVTLKTATVKKSAKKLILQATLAKVNKKYLKKKTVTFKFNGKKYKAKTNAKGVAKVTIKSSVLKKLKVGKKVTYQATYLKDTVKKTIKVKK